MQKQYRRLEKDEGSVSSKDNFEGAFKNNFYLSKEFAEFCSKNSNVELSNVTTEDGHFYLLNNKNISISNYNNDICDFFICNKISFMRVLNINNSTAEKKSIIEYSIIFQKKYEDAIKDYKHSFKEGVRQSKKYGLTCKILKEDLSPLDTVYFIYQSQVDRLNSFILPKSFFEDYIKLKGSVLFIVYFEDEPVSYGLGAEYKDNIYLSFAGSKTDFFKYRANNKLYDEIIKYACSKGLNVHLGLGISGTGYQKFKENTGAVNFKCERFPDDGVLINIGNKLLKLDLLKYFIKIINKLYEKRLVYFMIPFT
ncbi:MAG: GNAT family N-acetyltransferase [Nanoarchaeota archaeon]